MVRCFWLLLVPLIGCVTKPPVSALMTVPPDTANVCATHCGSLGMDLGAVVIVRDSAGCVCHPRSAAPTAAETSSAAVAGVLILDDEEEDQQRRSREQQQRRQRQRDQQQQRRSADQSTPRDPPDRPRD